MPQECPPGEGTGQAPRQSCRCPQVKRAVGTEAVSATGIWAGRPQYLPQLGKKYTTFPLCKGGSGWRLGQGTGGWHRDTQPHAGPDSPAAASSRVPTSPASLLPPLPERGPYKVSGTGRLCGRSSAGDSATPHLGPLLTPSSSAVRWLAFPQRSPADSIPFSFHFITRGRLWHRGQWLH